MLNFSILLIVIIIIAAVIFFFVYSRNQTRKIRDLEAKNNAQQREIGDLEADNKTQKGKIGDLEVELDSYSTSRLKIVRDNEDRIGHLQRLLDLNRKSNSSQTSCLEDSDKIMYLQPHLGSDNRNSYLPMVTLLALDRYCNVYKPGNDLYKSFYHMMYAIEKNKNTRGPHREHPHMRAIDHLGIAYAYLQLEIQQNPSILEGENFGPDLTQILEFLDQLMAAETGFEDKSRRELWIAKSFDWITERANTPDSYGEALAS